MHIHSSHRIGSSQELALRSAILIYDLRGGSGDHASLVTVHQVAYQNPDSPKAKAVIMPGQPVTPADIESLSSLLSKAAESMAWLPPNVLSISANRLVWYVPGRPRRIWFNKEAKNYMHLNGKFVAHPNLIFDATINAGLRVVAVATNKRPTPESPIYRAPYMNLYSLGEMCRGSSPMPKIFTPEAMRMFEDSFFNSAFSHSNLTGKAMCRHPRGPVAMWNALRPMKSFPPKWLATLGRAKGNRAHHDDSAVKTVGDFLKPHKWTGHHPL